MKLLLTFLCLISGVLAFEHGDLDARIKKLSKQIDKDPTNVELYMKRGELYYQHEEYRKSIVDFETARAFGIQSDELNILLARSYFKAGKHPIAIEFLDEILIKDVNNVQANRWKGEILMDQSQFKEVASAWTLALKHADKKTPEQFLDLALAYYKMKSDATTTQACETIKDGMLVLGDLPVLISRLVEYYSSVENHKEALHYQTKLIDISIRKDLPYYNRARLHIRQNNMVAARADLGLALNELNKLPQKIRNARATQNLKYEITSLHASIE